VKWDQLINDSINGSFYAWSWYLNAVCEEWEILVEGDYETGMVLPFKTKFGIDYLVQPFLTPQLGIFSRENIHPEKIKAFLDFLPHRFKWAQINLNKYNSEVPVNWKARKQKIFELDLISSVQQISAKYDKAIHDRLRLAEKEDLSIMKQLAPNDYISLWKKTSDTEQKYKEEEKKLRRLLSRGIHYKVCEINGVYSKFNNLIASSSFFSFRQKTTLLLTVFDQEEDFETPLIFLIHHFIKRNAGQNLTLKFELPGPGFQGMISANHPGKKLESMEKIFGQFGAQEFNYSSISIRNTGILIKLLKPFLK
jgi:hypothetical protein